MKRDWKMFFKLSLKSLKGSLIGLALVPVVFVLLNVNYLGTEDFYKGLIISLRIGAIVVLASIVFSTEAKEDKSLVGVKIKVSSHQLGSFYRISGLMLPSFLVSASL